MLPLQARLAMLYSTHSGNQLPRISLESEGVDGGQVVLEEDTCQRALRPWAVQGCSDSNGSRTLPRE
jgi:hypothetical protein